jgi:DNA-binding CsgD family transcriptional regulator
MIKSVYKKDKALFRKQIFRLLLLAVFTSAAVLSAEITVKEIVSLRNLLFVVGSAAVLSCTTVFGSTGKTFREKVFTAGVAFKRYVFFTGAFLTVLLVLAAVSNPSLSSEGAAVVSFRTFVVSIVLGLRPLLYGTALHILCSMLLFSEAEYDKPAENVTVPEYAAGTSEPVPTGSGCPSLLSRRELEVARLAVQGLTNAEIAEELYISVATVKRHLANIFEKNGITSRRELKEIVNGL